MESDADLLTELLQLKSKIADLELRITNRQTPTNTAAVASNGWTAKTAAGSALLRPCSSAPVSPGPIGALAMRLGTTPEAKAVQKARALLQTGSLPRNTAPASLASSMATSHFGHAGCSPDSAAAAASLQDDDGDGGSHAAQSTSASEQATTIQQHAGGHAAHSMVDVPSSSSGVQANQQASATQPEALLLASPAVPAPTPPPDVPMCATRVLMHQLVMPADCDLMGICQGGLVLSWIDICAGLSAKMLARGPCVTASVDTVHFLRPCRLGVVVIIAAMVNRTFASSMEVGVRVESEEMRTGRRYHCCSAYLTFVAKSPPTSAVSASGVSSAPTVSRTNDQHRMGGDRSGTFSNDGGGAGAKVKPQLPRVKPTTPEHYQIHRLADVRRQARLQDRMALRDNPQLAAEQDICRLQPITRGDGPIMPPPLQLRPAQGITHTSNSFNPCLSVMGQMLQQQQQQHLLLQLQAGKQAAGMHTSTYAQQTDVQHGGLSTVLSGELPSDVPPPIELNASDDLQSREQPCRPLVSPRLTVAYMTQSIMPQHANTLGITFGGQVMSWMLQCAYISASRLRGHTTLTACLDSVTFSNSTRVGHILYITTQATATFGSSLEVMCSVHGEDPSEGRIFHCADSFLTLVTVDVGGRPVQLPCDLQPLTQAERLRHAGAVARREERLRLRNEFAAGDALRPSLDGTLPAHEIDGWGEAV